MPIIYSKAIMESHTKNNDVFYQEYQKLEKQCNDNMKEIMILEQDGIDMRNRIRDLNWIMNYSQRLEEEINTLKCQLYKKNTWWFRWEEEEESKLKSAKFLTYYNDCKNKLIIGKCPHCDLRINYVNMEEPPPEKEHNCVVD